MSERARLEANLWRYQLFNAVVFTPFMLPVLVLYWQQSGLDMFEIYGLQGIFAIAVVLLEVPTGVVADRIGKRTSLVASAAVGFVSMVVYAMSHGFGGFLAAELGLALAASLYSGADSALLYDTLDELGRTDEYRAIEGRSKAIQMFGFAASNLVGGALGAWSLSAAMWASAIGPALALIVAWGMVEARPAAGASVREALSGYGALTADALRFVRKHRLVQWQIAWLAVLTGSAQWLLWSYQPYMELGGLPLWAFGAAFASFNVVSALSSQQADRFARWAGDRGTLWLLALAQIGALVALSAVVAPWSWVFIWGHQVVRGVARPVISARILRYTWADKRSTVLSIAGLASRLFFAATAIPIGLAANALPLPQALAVQAAALVVILGGLLVLREWIPAKYERVKGEVPTAAT